jgi:predicted RNA-binding Zn ribbon-like protein
MEAAKKIRSAVAQVTMLRQAMDATAALHAAVGEVKRVQSRRFAGSYADLLSGGPYAAAARFFLEELYSDKDYAERDAQFARIAGAIERLFPEQVAGTAVALAELHALTEELDQAMALAWLAHADSGLGEAQRYTAAWREVGRRPEREGQLVVVLGIGQQMARLTRTAGLRMMLKMMRGPAAAAGLGALQRFLECGFDTFAAMARRQGGAEDFLGIIKLRESALMALLFDADLVACETELARVLGQAP